MGFPGTVVAAHENAQIAQLLDALRQHLPAAAMQKIPRLLPTLPEPVAALQRLLEFYRRLPWEPEAEDFDGKVIYGALTAFASSRYLTNLLLNWPPLLRWSLAPEVLERTIPAGELRSDLGSFAAQADDESAALLLARFKSRHLLRIAMRDLLAVAPLADIAQDLSTLADVAIQGAHDHVRQQLVSRFGRPLCETGSGPILCNFAVVALGKLGGGELNYSSDVDLLYLHTGQGRTSGPVVTSNQDFTKQLASRLTKLLSVMTPEGFSYRVDLRLRPEGRAGELVVPLSSAAQYYFKRARDWELQMLLKARPVAGDLRLGREFLDLVTPRIYRTTTDFSQVEKLAETRDRMQAQRRRRGPGLTDVKLDPGGIRDIEFLVQCLQRLYGGQDRFLRSGGTMYALHRLREKGYLATADYSRLFNAYRFLRKVEHRLQLADNKQTHEVPRADAALRQLARQLGLSMAANEGSPVLAEIRSHCSSVGEIYQRVIRSQQPRAAAEGAERPAQGTAAASSGDGRRSVAGASVWQIHLPRLQRYAPKAAEAVENLSLRWGNRAFEQFLERALSQPAVLGTLDRQPRAVQWIGELMEYSPHFAGYLLRFPEDASVIAESARAAAGRAGPDDSEQDLHVSLEAILASDVDPDETAAELRRLFRRRMLQIQTRSICGGEDVFRTLSAASDLAEWILRAAHALALQEAARRAAQPINLSAAVRIVALGRLGMREFDLGSDADMVFVLPDSEGSRAALWTQVANRVIDIVASYTADGRMFTIDPRLRPLGRDGELVQTESQYLTYFSGQAESWEALTYMKARTVAGDPRGGKEFLARLQERLWRRFAHREELRELLFKMRLRLEEEQGDGKPLKSGAGGYYDIDFLLLYWRLLRAESFYESLNTPQRIEIIRATDPALAGDLDVLLEATRFYRSLDHGVRVSHGTSSHALPPTEWQRERLAKLVARWLPQAETEPLEAMTQATQASVREVFWRAFRLQPSSSGRSPARTKA